MSKYGVFFWSVFSRIWAEYGDLRSKSPYSVQMRENAGKTPYLDSSCSESLNIRERLEAVERNKDGRLLSIKKFSSENTCCGETLCFEINLTF